MFLTQSIKISKLLKKKKKTPVSHSQFLIYCTDLSQCDLLVYNKKNPIVIKIEKDDLFLQLVLTRLHYFYFLLPKINNIYYKFVTIL